MTGQLGRLISFEYMGRIWFSLLEHNCIARALMVEWHLADSVHIYTDP
jgi:hypothetical protein